MKAVLFTDGAARGNPGPGGWAFVLIVDERSVYEGTGAESRTTNNAMELSAVIAGITKVYELIDTPCRFLVINLDSKYVRDGCISWRHGWARNDWKTRLGQPVANKELWIRLNQLLDESATRGITIEWNLVRGHRGIPGNERCDSLATRRADTGIDESYCGDIDHHPIGSTLMVIPTTTDPYYIALVDGVIQKFTSWDDCSQSIRGTSARYKKVYSAFEEDQVLESWGITRE